MAQPHFDHLDCRPQEGILIATLKDSHLGGDELADALRHDLLAAADHFNLAKWVIDFRQVEFFTSAGIRPLLALHRKLQSAGARLIFCNLRPEIAEVMHATRLLATPGTLPGPFEAARDIDEALHRLRHHSSRVERGILILSLFDKEFRTEELAVALGSELQASLAANESRRVVIDFSGVQLITTHCLRSILQLRSQLKEKGGQIVVCGLAPQVAEIFSITRLTSNSPETPGVLSAYPDVAAAVASLSA